MEISSQLLKKVLLFPRIKNKETDVKIKRPNPSTNVRSLSLSAIRSPLGLADRVYKYKVRPRLSKYIHSLPDNFNPHICFVGSSSLAIMGGCY